MSERYTVINACLPENETDRLAALHEHKLLDTAPEEQFDDLVRLAAQVCGTPIAALSLVDEHRQWFKAITGLNATQTPRDVAFCAHTILQTDLLVVADATKDQRFADNPLVTGEDPHIRFYAGVPLITEDGFALGSLCVIDRVARTLTPDQEETLRLLARQASSHLRAARRIAERESLVAEKHSLVLEKERLAAIVEYSKDAIYAKTLDGAIASWNAGAEKLYGYSAAEMIGQHVDLLAPPERRGEIRDILAALRRGETVAPEETVRVTKAGHRVDVSLQVSPVQDADGRVVGASVIARDITEQKQTQIANTRLAAIVEASEDAIYGKTLDGTITTWNRGAEKLYGYRADEMIGRHVGVLVPTDCQDELSGIMDAVRRGDAIPSLETVRVTKAGGRVDVSLRVSPVRDADNTVVGAFMIARDVTARKKADDALAESNSRLHESEDRLRRLTDAAFEGIVISQDGLVVDASPAFATMFGYDAASELAGLEVSGLTAPESQAGLAQKVVNFDEESYEPTLLRRDGTTFQSEVRPRTIQLGGRPARITAVRDISERKAMEMALRTSQARLVEAQQVSGIGDFDLDVVTGRVTWSAEMFRLLEFDPAEGEPSLDAVRERICHEDRDMRDRLFAHSLATGEPFSCDIHIQLPSGAPRCLRLVGNPVPNADGTVTRMTGVMLDITQQKAMETQLLERAERLRESEAQTAVILESIDDAFFSLDAQWRFTYVNSQAERRLLRTREQILGHILWDVFPEAVGSVFYRQYQRAVDEGITVTFEAYYEPLESWSSVSAYPTQNGGLSVFFQDVTERKALDATLLDRAERLRQSEAGLRAVLEGAPVILYATDAGGMVTLSEGTGLAALGLKPGEVVGRSVFEFSGGDAEIEAKTRRALAGETVSYDAQLGGLSLHTELRPVWGADGSPNGLIGVCFDVTERALAEERFRVLFEQSSDAHLLLGEQGIIDCNAATVSLLHCQDKAEVLGLHPAVMSPEFQPDGRLSREKKVEMDALARENGFHRFEWVLRKTDGQEFPVEVSLTPVTLAGCPVLLSVMHDLTERKQAEERLQDYAIVLEAQKQQLEQVNAELAALATSDGLTGLKNHRAFQERLAVEVGLANRHGEPLSLIILDVDHFKEYNDAFGHPAGDSVLRAVALALEESVRDTDLAARYGGEEFVLLLPQTNLDGAAVVAERMRVWLERHSWPQRSVTASFGVATLRLGERRADLIARADVAMYESKVSGRNRVTCSLASESTCSFEVSASSTPDALHSMA